MCTAKTDFSARAAIHHTASAFLMLHFVLLIIIFHSLSFSKHLLPLVYISDSHSCLSHSDSIVPFFRHVELVKVTLVLAMEGGGVGSCSV